MAGLPTSGIQSSLAAPSLPVEIPELSGLLRFLEPPLARALQEAATGLGRYGGGDYSPDTNTGRFPEVGLPAPSVATPRAAPKGDGVLTLAELLNHKEKTPSQKAKTDDGHRFRVRDFAKFIGHEDARRVTREEIRDWRTNLQARGASVPRPSERSK